MSQSEPNVTDILDSIIEGVLMRNDAAMATAERQLCQVAGINPDDDLADLALFNVADAANKALFEACSITFWAGAAYGRGVNVAAGAELVD